MLLVNGEKMSKSLGNFLTVRDVLAARAGRGDAAAAAAHALPRRRWISPTRLLAEARKDLDRFYRALDRAPGGAGGRRAGRR